MAGAVQFHGEGERTVRSSAGGADAVTAYPERDHAYREFILRLACEAGSQCRGAAAGVIGYHQSALAQDLAHQPLERINKEIKRRSRVVGIFPNSASAIRLTGAILADMHDEWQATERRYLSEESMTQLNTPPPNHTTTELTTST